MNPSPRDLFLSEFGYPTVLRDVDPRGWDTADSDARVIIKILTQGDHGGIILCHDIRERTIRVMPAMLDGLLAQGPSLMTVSVLLAMKGN
jgi:peptidoglycan/xylan/chitin deacetylase (PgdA/CDA1 family)